MDGSSHTADDSAPQPRYRARGDVPVSLVTSGPAPDTGPAISLGPRDVLVGRLVFEGDLRVQGRNLDVRGALEGEVTARERLLVAGSGTVSGTIRVARLAVEDGALLNGTITMERSGEGHSQGA